MKKGSNRLPLIVVAVVAILVIAAVPVWAATSTDTEAADRFAQALGFDDAEHFASVFGLLDEEEQTLDSKAADEYAQSLGFASAEDMADFLDLEGGEDEIARALRDTSNPNDLARALGLEDARALAEALDVDSREELAAFLRLENGEEGLDQLLQDSDDPGDLARALGFENAGELAAFVNPSGEGSDDDLAVLLGNGDPSDVGVLAGVVSSSSEQESESGDVSMSARVTNSGDYASQTAPSSQVANTGNFQNQVTVTQSGSSADDIEPGGISAEISPEQAVQSEQEVQQAAAAESSSEEQAAPPSPAAPPAG